MEKCIYSTGNSIVDKVGKMNISGNIIPEAWYRTIVSKNGKTNSNAILILSEIVYWYRPSEERDENNNITKYKKRFRANDYLQKSYEQLCEKFNLSKRQVRDCLILLEELGVITRHFRCVNTNIGKCSNVMYIELIPDVLEQLTFPDADGDIHKNDNRSLLIGNDRITSEIQGTNKSVNTYTYTEADTISENTTTGVDDGLHMVSNILKSYQLSVADIEAIYEAANHNIDVVQKAQEVLKNQTVNIRNTTGWIIQAIRNNYTSNPKVTKGDLLQNHYDFLDLEKKLLTS